jgi:hypothetical protein
MYRTCGRASTPYAPHELFCQGNVCTRTGYRMDDRGSEKHLWATTGVALTHQWSTGLVNNAGALGCL